MGSRHHSLQMTEVADVTDVLNGFEMHNNVRIEIRLNVLLTSKGPDLVMRAAAHDAGREIGDLPSLASVSVKCSAMNLRTMMGALTHLLYALDFQLALNEMGGNTKAGETAPPH